jgi:hypothetical protein
MGRVISGGAANQDWQGPGWFGRAFLLLLLKKKLQSYFDS